MRDRREKTSAGGFTTSMNPPFDNMKIDWSSEELKIEWKHVYETRLGILCEDRQPIPDQIEIATKEADEHIELLRSEI